MQVLQSSRFKKLVKKLNKNQKKDLDSAILKLIEEPYLGEAKVGDLAGVLVYKFKMNKQLTLLAYTYCDHKIILTLLAVGSHENFYRDLKKSGN